MNDALMRHAAVGRNEPCPCGSGRRYKECHGGLDSARNAVAPRADASKAEPRSARDWHALGATALGRADFAAAAAFIDRAIALDSMRAEFHRDLARARLGMGVVTDATASARRAVDLDATDAGAWNALGLCIETTDPDAALAAWQRARALAPRDVEAHFRIGNCLRRRGDFTRAGEAYRTALAIAPDSAIVLNNLALALQGEGDLIQAERHYRAALEREPRLLEALANLGELLKQTGRFAEAIASLTKALALKADVAQLWTALGLCQYRLGRMNEARASFERANALDPNDPVTYTNVASVLLAQARYAEAAPLVRNALALQPGLAEAESMLLFVNQQTCEWDHLDHLVERSRERLLRDDAPPVVPHSLFALPYTQAELFTATRNWVERHIRPRRAPPPSLTQLTGGRLRIAYLGSDFRAHPFANLITEVIERHDRSRFEVFAYSFGPDDGSAQRARFTRAFDRFIDVRDETFDETAKRIRDDRVAILLDSGGHVIYARNEIFALRAAPIQINCMFPGTLGADYYDYLMTDAFVTPPGQQVYFTERFLLLPHCYMPSDTRRPVAAVPTRAQCGLEDDALVFCCFNASYKILPNVFSIWMRLLREAPASVLWLLDTDAAVKTNLRREAQARGVSPDRLLFAPRVPTPEHLARHAVADLFLDTFPYNAHTTTNDALFTGLPVLTCAGGTFASRVSGSHLHAIGLSELVTYSLDDYEKLALTLAHDRGLLASFKVRLRENQATHPLFDMDGYTRAFDRLLWRAWEEWLARTAIK